MTKSIDPSGVISKVFSELAGTSMRSDEGTPAGMGATGIDEYTISPKDLLSLIAHSLQAKRSSEKPSAWQRYHDNMLGLVSTVHGLFPSAEGDEFIKQLLVSDAEGGARVFGDTSNKKIRAKLIELFQKFFDEGIDTKKLRELFRKHGIFEPSAISLYNSLLFLAERKVPCGNLFAFASQHISISKHGPFKMESMADVYKAFRQVGISTNQLRKNVEHNDGLAMLNAIVSCRVSAQRETVRRALIATFTQRRAVSRKKLASMARILLSAEYPLKLRRDALGMLRWTGLAKSFNLPKRTLELFYQRNPYLGRAPTFQDPEELFQSIVHKLGVDDDEEFYTLVYLDAFFSFLGQKEAPSIINGLVERSKDERGVFTVPSWENSRGEALAFFVEKHYGVSAARFSSWAAAIRNVEPLLDRNIQGTLLQNFIRKDCTSLSEAKKKEWNERWRARMSSGSMPVPETHALKKPSKPPPAIESPPKSIWEQEFNILCEIFEQLEGELEPPTADKIALEIEKMRKGNYIQDRDVVRLKNIFKREPLLAEQIETPPSRGGGGITDQDPFVQQRFDPFHPDSMHLRVPGVRGIGAWGVCAMSVVTPGSISKLL